MLLHDQNTSRLVDLLKQYGDINSSTAKQKSLLAMANIIQGYGDQLPGLRPMNLNYGTFYAGPSGAEQGMNIFSKLLSGAMSGASLGMMPEIADQTNAARQGALTEMLPFFGQAAQTPTGPQQSGMWDWLS